MINDEIRTIKLERLSVCHVLMAITHLRCDCMKELDDDSISDDRRKVAQSSLQKWNNLHEKIKNQLEGQDKENISDCNYYEERNLELVAKVYELETQLLQYQTYIAELTTTIQKNICKDFCPNIE